MPNWNIEGKNVLITGASGHLGSVIAQSFSQAGCRVFLQGRNESKLLDLQKKLTGESIVFAGDISDPLIIDKIFSKIGGKYKSLDFLINNAGLQTVLPINQLESRDWEIMMSINTKVPHLCTKAFLELNKKYPSGNPVIVNIASIEGSIPALAHSHYAASKGALIQYTRASALELGAYGIRVNSVSPGLIDHENLKKDWPEGVIKYVKSSPLSRLVDPVEVADTVLFLSSPYAHGITGVDLRVDAGMGVVQGY